MVLMSFQLEAGQAKSTGSLFAFDAAVTEAADWKLWTAAVQYMAMNYEGKLR